MTKKAIPNQDKIFHDRIGLILAGIVIAMICLIALLKESPSSKYLSTNLLLNKSEKLSTWLAAAFEVVAILKW